MNLPIVSGAALLGLASSAGAQSPSFSEQTGPAGINVTFESSGYAHSGYSGGGTVGDFNNDGWQDLFVLDGGDNGLRDKLYINQQNGTFTDEAMAWGLTSVHKGKGASTADFNGDGWMDIYVTSAGQSGSACAHKLYKNNGNGTFTDIATMAGVNCTSPIFEDSFGSGWGDIDLDGDLDLMVAGFESNNAGSRLFQNNGNETFTDITALSTMFDQTPFNISGFAPRLQDMDGDFYPELLLAADFGTSRYFRNNTDGTFTDITAASGTGQDENGMGQTVGDYNGDGLLDWYVQSIYWVSLGWTGNKMYLNQGGNVFSEVATGAGVFDGGYAWGAVSIDFNHDQLLDVASTNGGLGLEFFGEQTYLFMNQGGGVFSENAVAAGLVHNDDGRGMINFDYDNDGDQDVVIFANEYPVRLYRNDLVQAANTTWLRVFLDSSADSTVAPNGYGSRVTATVNGNSMLRVITTGDNCQSHSEISAHFGLGSASLVDQLEIEWPNGDLTVMNNIAVNQTITVVKSSACPITMNYCVAATNSTGSGGVMGSHGSGSLLLNDFALDASGLPPNQIGLFYYGPGQAAAPFGDGLRCVSAGAVGVFRLNPPTPINGLGETTRPIDMTSPPTANGTLSPGSTWNFQYWYRDPAAGMSGFNLTDGLQATFCP